MSNFYKEAEQIINEAHGSDVLVEIDDDANMISIEVNGKNTFYGNYHDFHVRESLFDIFKALKLRVKVDRDWLSDDRERGTEPT